MRRGWGGVRRGWGGSNQFCCDKDIYSTAIFLKVVLKDDLDCARPNMSCCLPPPVNATPPAPPRPAQPCPAPPPTDTRLCQGCLLALLVSARCSSHPAAAPCQTAFISLLLITHLCGAASHRHTYSAYLQLHFSAELKPFSPHL